ncbi:alpha/beta hydrolase fold domain-containing protein [Caulobacter segnis]
MGDLETCHASARSWPGSSRTAVISVDYRLAPDHKFPAGLERTCWPPIAGRATTPPASARPRPRRPSAAAGMGGNFAAIVAQEMQRQGEPQPAAQILIYPAVDVASETPSTDHLCRRLSADPRDHGLVHGPL